MRSMTTPVFAAGAVIVLFMAGAGLTFQGLAAMNPELWEPASHLARFLFLWGVVGLALVVASRWRRFDVLQVASAIAAGLALATGQLGSLLAVLCLGLSSLALGRLVLTTRLTPAASASDIDSVLVGLALHATAVGLLAFLPVNYPGTYAVQLLVPAILGRKHIAATTTRWRAWAVQARPADIPLALLKSAVAAMALLHFLMSFMPEMGYDALAMHLFIPAQLAWRHEWGFDVDTYVWAVFPMLGDWVYSIAYMLAGETGARFANVGCILLVAALVREIALWAGSGEKGAWWAVLLFLTTPLTFTESSSLFIESVWCCMVLGGAFAILRLQSGEGDAASCILVAGILLGGALSAKAATFTALPVLFVVFVVAFRQWAKTSLAVPLAAALMACLVLGGIPYLTAWSLTGNPVFPLFNGYFQSPHYQPENFSTGAVFERGVTWDLFYRMTFESSRFLEARAGASGFQWLLLLLPALAALTLARHRRGLLLLAVAGAILWLTFHQTAYLRYVFPSFALACVVAGIIVGAIFPPGSLVMRVALVAAIVTVALNIQFFSSGTYSGKLGFRALVSDEARVDYLAERAPTRIAVQMVNALNIKGKPVALLAQQQAAGLRADVLHPNWYNYRFYEQVRDANTAAAFGSILARRDVQYVILDDYWGDEAKRQLANTVTREVARVGTVSVRELTDDYRYTHELLVNPGFEAVTGWSVAELARIEPGRGAIVTVASPVTQYAAAEPGVKYRYTVTASCLDAPTDGRLQVNWLDKKSNMLKVDIETFTCTGTATAHRMEVRAPAGAAGAMVYASGHTPEPLLFSSVSFKE